MSAPPPNELERAALSRLQQADPAQALDAARLARVGQRLSAERSGSRPGLRRRRYALALVAAVLLVPVAFGAYARWVEHRRAAAVPPPPVTPSEVAPVTPSEVEGRAGAGTPVTPSGVAPVTPSEVEGRTEALGSAGKRPRVIPGTPGKRPPVTPSEVEGRVEASAPVAGPVPSGPEASAVAAGPAPGLLEETQLLGEALRQLRVAHQPSVALQTLEGYRARFPQGELRAEVTLARVDALLQLGRESEALGELAEVKGPRAAEAQLLRAELLAKAGRCREALPLFKTLREDVSERALYGRGLCRREVGELAGARADFEETLRRFPQGRYAAAARVALEGLPR